MEQRYSRHEGLFGAQGQGALAGLCVAIVGVGGLGSHVAQQLAYLGVTRFVIVDFDVVTWSSLNRLVGALPADAVAAVKKILVAARTIKAINPDAVVDGFDAAIADPAAARAVAGADVVFGCVDRDVHRLELTELCARHARTYIDLATDVHPHDGGVDWGGRVVVCDGTRCLVCLPEILDQESIAVDRLSVEQRAARRRVYGVAQDALLGTGPSVVSLNGVVASLAVNEFLVSVTGLRAPAPQLVYDATTGAVRICRDESQGDCYYCTGLWGTATQAPGRAVGE